ncbi:MAG: peroxiredoxin-like family protein, partial [Prochlorococcaceae cyanobacterium]
MKAPDALLSRLAAIPELVPGGRRRLVVLLSQLGDFDSLEYAQALAHAQTRLDAAGISMVAIGIGDERGADRFCRYTGLSRQLLQVEADAQLHRSLGLYPGLQSGLGPWPDLLLMCAGIGSPGTLAEVFRGYSGDRSAPQRFERDPTFSNGSLPSL